MKIKTIKVVHILNDLRASGAEQMLFSARNIYKDNSIETSIVSLHERGGDYEKTLKSVFNVFFIKFNRYFKAFPSFLMLLKLYVQLKKIAPDVVHIHPERANFSVCLVSLLLPKVRVVRTVHHIFPKKDGSFGYVIMLVKIVQRKITTYLGVRYFSNSLSGANNELIVYKNKTETIFNWFDSNNFKKRNLQDYENSRSVLKIPDDIFVVVSIGGNWEYKNFNLIADVVGDCGDDFIFLHVGPTGDYDISTYAKSKGFSNTITYGYVDSTIDFLHAADVFLMVSDIEGFCCAVVEAMSVNIPVILSDRPALSDYRHFCSDVEYVSLAPASIKENLLHQKNKKNKTKKRLWVEHDLDFNRAANHSFSLDSPPKKWCKVYLDEY
jgi:glycosyltransferase involved in cell wall biosynthesis